MIKNIPHSVIRSLSEQWEAEGNKFQERLDDSSASTLLDDYLRYQGIIGYTQTIQDAFNAILLNKLPANIKEYAINRNQTFNTIMDLVEHLFEEFTKEPPQADPSAYGYCEMIPPPDAPVNKSQVRFHNLQAIQLLLSESSVYVDVKTSTDAEWYIPIIKDDTNYRIVVKAYDGMYLFGILCWMDGAWVQCKDTKPYFTFYEVQDFVIGTEE